MRRRHRHAAALAGTGTGADLSTPVRHKSLDTLPTFATDAELGAALLGSRSAEWPAMAAALERRGFPKIDRRFGGRYVRAVVAWLDRDYGLGSGEVKVPDGEEMPCPIDRRRRA